MFSVSMQLTVRVAPEARNAAMEKSSRSRIDISSD
jgi:hypothetical protein